MTAGKPSIVVDEVAASMTARAYTILNDIASHRMKPSRRKQKKPAFVTAGRFTNETAQRVARLQKTFPGQWRRDAQGEKALTSYLIFGPGDCPPRASSALPLHQVLPRLRVRLGHVLVGFLDDLVLGLRFGGPKSHQTGGSTAGGRLRCKRDAASNFPTITHDFQ